jgi:N,N'-diacetyllegionaminate synthase
MDGILIVAEIAQAHEGSLGIAHSYIDALAEAGVDAIKFQTHIAKAESSAFEQFRVKFSYEDATRFDYWRRMEFTTEQWQGLKEHCDRAGVEFISSPFSNAAVDLLERIGVNRYKIGSGEITNLLLLEKVARTSKPVILSSGMSAFYELEQAIAFLKSFGNHLTVLQCTTAYPTKPEEWGLNVMAEFKERFNIPIGFSDHSGDIYACLAAAALGAQVLEFHAVFDQRMFGPDAKASITIDRISDLVKGVRAIEKSLNVKVNKEEDQKFKDLKIMFGKTLATNKDLPRGHVVTFNDLESKKPGDQGIRAGEYRSVIGKKLKKAVQAYDFLTKNDFNEEA